MILVVTGASGFIGRNLAKSALVARGWQVHSLGIEPSFVTGVVDHVVEDIAGDEAVKELRKIGADGIVHLAAAGVNPADRDFRRLLSVNAVLPARMLEAASKGGIGIFVMAGTCSEYARAAGYEPLSERAPLDSGTLYGATKAAGGLLALAAGAELGIRAYVLRLFNVYGPGEGAHRLLPTLAGARSGATPARLSAGSQIRDFVYIDDACAAFERTVASASAGGLPAGAYNVCTGQGASVREFASLAAEAMSLSERSIEFGAVPMRPDETPCIVGDPRLLSEALGWSPSIPLEVGIRRYVSALGGS